RSRARAWTRPYSQTRQDCIEVQLRDDPNRFAQDLFTGLPRRYDVLEGVLSFGQNARWRRTMIDAILPAEPGRVLDVATGPAGVAFQITGRSGASVVGLALTEAMRRTGLDEVHRSARAGRISLVAGQAERLPFPDASFDALTFTYLLRYVADPAATLRELA